MYGYPKEVQRSVRTVVLDLPREVEKVTDIHGERPPIEVYGPLYDGDKPAAENLQTPEGLDVENTTIRVHYTPALAHGEYRVVVYQSRITAKDGDSFDLRNKDGTPFAGWDLTVLQHEPRHEARPPDREPVSEPAPKPYAAVLLDGKEAPKCEMSGEILTVVTETPEDVTLDIQPLVPQEAPSLYASYVTRKEHTVNGQPAVSFMAAGPVFDYKYALYNGHSTPGRVPIDNETRRPAVYLPLFRQPVPAQYEPLIDVDSTVVEKGLNTYAKATYTVRPRKDIGNLFAYQTPPFVFPVEIDDEYNTPDRNPRLFPDSIYLPEAVGPLNVNTGPLDLPLNSWIEIKMNGGVVWEGQTRLLPTLVTPRRVKTELGWDFSTEEERCAVLRQVWDASQEALGYWECPFRSSSVPATLSEFVIARLANPISREDGTQGVVTTRVGDETFTGQSDNAAASRLANIADLLSDCEETLPIQVEDHIPMGSAGLASEADNEWYPALNQRSRAAARRIAPHYYPEYYKSLRAHRGEYIRWSIHA